jgi:hypothetical protein
MVLPVFLWVTPAHVHDSVVGWFVIFASAVIFSFKALVIT